MGRPPLNMRVTTIRLADETLEQIDALVGKHHRPAFIRRAIERELERVKNEKAAREK